MIPFSQGCSTRRDASAYAPLPPIGGVEHVAHDGGVPRKCPIIRGRRWRRRDRVDRPFVFADFAFARRVRVQARWCRAVSSIVTSAGCTECKSLHGGSPASAAVSLVDCLPSCSEDMISCFANGRTDHQHDHQARPPRRAQPVHGPRRVAPCPDTHSAVDDGRVAFAQSVFSTWKPVVSGIQLALDSMRTDFDRAPAKEIVDIDRSDRAHAEIVAIVRRTLYEARRSAGVTSAARTDSDCERSSGQSPSSG